MNELSKNLLILQEYITAKVFRKFADRKELADYQKENLEKMIHFTFKNSPYYRENLREPTLQNFYKLPHINKNIMMENFNRLNTQGLDREQALETAIKGEKTRDFSPTINNITIGLSSGTSGHRGIFCASQKEQAKYAGVVLAKLLPRSIFGKHRIGYFLRSDSNLYQSGENKNIEFCYFDMLNSLEENIEKLNQFRPTTLLAPPSILRKLAYKKELGSLKIQPEKLFSIAEVLDPLDEKYIGKAFKQIVHQIYQCTEGFLGASCKHGTMHLNEDLVHIDKEFINEEKTKFMPIISDFTRTTQPYLRYKLNDVLVLKKDPCPCGSPLLAIEAIEGRCDDVFYFKEKNSEKLIPVYSDFIRRVLLFTEADIKEYQVKQVSFQNVEIKLDSASYTQPKIVEEVRAQFIALSEELNFQLPQLEFNDQFEELGLNKLRRIRREFKIE